MAYVISTNQPKTWVNSRQPVANWILNKSGEKEMASMNGQETSAVEKYLTDNFVSEANKHELEWK